MTTSSQQPLILASQSPYRRSLLARLELKFDVHSPDVDETPLPQETPTALALRLAKQKATVVSQRFPNAIVIGSDQVASFDNHCLGKAHSIENACAQLASFSGKQVNFYTGLAVINGETNQMHSTVETYSVQFRTLSAQEIRAYVERERPLDSAGSFYMEGLGVALFSKMEGSDPTTLMGLPLIRLCDFLREMGIDPLLPR